MNSVGLPAVDWIGLGGGLLSSDLQGAFRNALNLVLAEFWNFFWPLAHRLIGNAKGFGYLRNAAEVADHFLVIGDSSSLAPIQACLQLQSKHAWQATL